MATATRHVVTSVRLVDPVLALGALLCADLLSPLDKLIIFGLNIVVDFFEFLLGLNLVACVLNVVHHFTLEAVFDSALGTEAVRLLLIILDEHIIAAIGHALPHVRIAVSNLFPFKLLATFHLLWR